MTHEANLSDKQIEDEWQVYCEELAKDTDGVEDGRAPMCRKRRMLLPKHEMNDVLE